MCDMIYLCVWHDSLLCVTWPVYMCDMVRLHVWHGPFTCVTWPVYMCDMCDVVFSYVWHVSFICVTFLIHMYGMSHSYVFHCPCMKLCNIVSILILWCALDLHVMCARFPWDVRVTYLTLADLTWTYLHMKLCRIARMCRALNHLTHSDVTWLIHT